MNEVSSSKPHSGPYNFGALKVSGLSYATEKLLGTSDVMTVASSGFPHLCSARFQANKNFCPTSDSRVEKLWGTSVAKGSNIKKNKDKQM